MKDLKVGDKVEVEISKITIGEDKNLYVTVKSPVFDNKPSFLLRENKFVWESSDGRFVVK